MKQDLVSFIKAALRRVFGRSKLKTVALQKARIKRGLYECNSCHKAFNRKNIQVDHIEPVINPKFGFEDWNIYIDRLFTDKLQVLCIQCHKNKSRKENETRRLEKK